MMLVLQLSVNVGSTAKLTALKHWLVSGPGTLAATGAIVSWTLLLLLPLPPRSTLSPDTTLCLSFPSHGVPLVTVLSTLTLMLVLQLSVNVGRTAKLTALKHWLVNGPGTLAATGAIVSWTKLVWLTVLVLPQPSSACQVRITCPSH